MSIAELSSNGLVHLEPFRLLILGGGAIVAECHLPALKALRWLENCEVLEPYAPNAKVIRDRFPSVKVSATPYQEALPEKARSGRFDGVLIALPNTLHAEASMRCLQVGLSVLCEKPLAMTAEECREVGSTAQKQGRQVFAGMVRRFTPAFTALRQALANGMAGDIQRVVIEHGSDCKHWPWDTETVLRRDQGGCLVNMGIHFLDLLEWIFGSLKPVSYKDDLAGGIEMNCDFRLVTKASIPLELRISWTRSLANVFKIEGTRGTLTADLGKFDAVRWCAAGHPIEASVRTQLPFESGDWQNTFESCFVEQLWKFAVAVQSGGCRDLVTPEVAARSHDLIEWAYRNRTRPPKANLRGLRPGLPPAAVVVTGGTGFVGSHLVERLAELEMTSIIVPVRNFRSGSQIARFPVTMKRADLLNPASCRSALKGAKHVFHLAYGTDGFNASRVTIEGTRNVLRSALEEGVTSVVVFSTCTVWGEYQNMLVTEDLPARPALGNYGRSKAQMQKECLEFARQHPEMRVSVVAPGSVYGPRSDLFCITPSTAAKAGKFAWFEGGRGICNPVYVANLVDLAILAAQKSDAHGQVFIAVDAQSTWKEFLSPLVEPWLDAIPNISLEEAESLKRASERNGTLKDLMKSAINSPEIMASVSNHHFLGRLKEEFSRIFPAHRQSLLQFRPVPDRIIKPVQISGGLAAWMADIYGPSTVAFSSAKARKILGWEPHLPLQEGMSMSVEWLRQTGIID